MLAYFWLSGVGTGILEWQMASAFTAFNHANDLKLISRHLTDVLCMPQSILTMFEQGAFVVSSTGRAWHSVGINEAHEMLIKEHARCL